MEKDSPWELYDLLKDKTEIHNVAEKHLDIVKELADQWGLLTDEYQVYPSPE